MKALENNPLPGDFDAEDETLYRPRQRNISVKRSRFPHRLRRMIGWFFLGGLAMVPLAYGGIRLLGYALHSPRFRVRGSDDVLVEGNRFVSREEVLTAMGFPLYWTAGESVNVFRLNLDEERRQVEAISWVRSATFTRVFPHRLAVHIVERTPVAFVIVGGRIKLIDAEGALLEKPEKSDFNFPVLEGLTEPANGSERMTRLALYQEFMKQLSADAPSSGWLISEVNLADADDLKALLVQGQETIDVHFGHGNFHERFSDFLTLLPEVRKTNVKIDSIDLRYRNQVVVDPQKDAAKRHANGNP